MKLPAHFKKVLVDSCQPINFPAMNFGPVRRIKLFHSIVYSWLLNLHPNDFIDTTGLHPRLLLPWVCSAMQCVYKKSGEIGKEDLSSKVNDIRGQCKYCSSHS